VSQDAGIDIDYDDDPAALDRELARLQAETAPKPEQPGEAGSEEVTGEVIDQRGTIEFLGKRFRVADKIGLMPLLKFSAHADMSTTDPRALGAMYAMLRDCIHGGSPGCGTCPACQDDDEERCKSYDPGDWKKFEEHAIEVKAEADELLDVIARTIEVISGRPTEPRSGSSPGRRGISAGSTARSSSRRGRGSRR
jgi:hypothetical protein